MKKQWKKILSIFCIIYALYACIILGGKLRYDHPRILPSVNGGKVDDWQFDQTNLRSYYYDDSTPWEKFWNTQNMSAHWVKYLVIGFLVEFGITTGILIIWGIVSSLRRGIITVKTAKNKTDRKVGIAKIMIGVPGIVILLFIAWLFLAWVLDEFFYWYGMYRLIDWGMMLLMLAFIASCGYLFFSGLVNWGSEKATIKKYGKRKFLWSLVYFLPCSWIIFNIIRTIGFGSSNLQVASFTDSSSSIPKGITVSTNSGVSLNSIKPMSGASSMSVDSLSFATESYEMDDTIGLAVGGANDVDNFRENIKNDYLPEPTDISYEGIFYDYYFDTGAKETCDKLFCPSYSTAISPDPYTGEDQYFISVGLNSGMKQSDFARKPLNLMVVMDISGSMSSSFDNYYYSSFSGDDNNRDSKMNIANETLVNLMSHLQDDDRFAVVLFDQNSYLAKPFRLVGDTDMQAIGDHILEIHPQGATNMSAGIEEAMREFQKIDTKDTKYENRIIFLTDMMPNTGETSENGLFGKIRQLARDRIYTTFIGVGVDLNTQLASELTQVRGANYYSVHSALDFRRRLADEFEYMVTPLVFDLDLIVEAPGYEIQQVYGSPEADQATGKIMTVNTLFPSASSGGENKGGLVLLQLTKRAGSVNDTITVRTSYTDRDGHSDGDGQTFTFTGEPDVFPNTGIAKGIALTRYVSVIKDWLLATRYTDLQLAQDKVAFSDMEAIGPQYYAANGIRCIHWPVIDGRWERGSRPLTVPTAYVPVFTVLRDYLREGITAIGDDTMLQETDILDLLILKGEQL